MATCNTHRFCTCDTYTSGSKSSIDASGAAGSKCSSNSNTGGYTNSSRTESDSGRTICYGYSTNCKVHYTSCHPDTTGYAYDCQGHRSYDISRSVSISNCAPDKIIDNAQINAIQAGLRSEITARKAHLMYSFQSQISYSESNVTEGSLISDFQPNKIKDALEKLRARIVKLPDYKVAPINTYAKVAKGDITQSKSLNDLLADFNSQHVDCICYSDCTAYGLWKYRTCTCNINCRCNY